MSDVISKDLKTVLKGLRLSRMLDTLPERLAQARQGKLPHQDFLLTVLGDESSRRQSNAVRFRSDKAGLDPAMQIEAWDETATVLYDRELLNELTTLRFLEARYNVAIVGPVGVGKTFLAHALGHIATRRGISALAVHHQVAPPTITLDEADPECDLDYVPHTKRAMPIRHVLSNSFGFGGTNAALILRRYEG